MDDVEMEVEDKDLPRKAMGARLTGHAANQRREVLRGEPAFDGSQRASSWAPPNQVSLAQAQISLAVGHEALQDSEACWHALWYCLGSTLQTEHAFAHIAPTHITI